MKMEYWFEVDGVRVTPVAHFVAKDNSMNYIRAITPPAGLCLTQHQNLSFVWKAS